MGYESYQQLGVDVADGVATLTLRSGQKFNAVTWQMHHELGLIFDDLTRDPDVRVIVLTGAGDAFCAGADLNWLRNQLQDPPTPREAREAGRAIVLGILDCPKPVIARVNGDAIGLGASLALLSDIVIAVDTCKFADPHVRIGLVAGDGGALIWPLLIGYARAKEYLLTGNAVPAADAVRMGLVNHAVPAGELDATVQRYARQLADGATMAIQFTKTSTNIPLRQAVESVLEASLAYESMTLRSQDAQEGVASFLERRKPNFVGR
ncbi:enoyl-CoA hydratase/isomerase family protein (plasmid) [Diaphorobacter sp. HDW4B]|uniref:enoyl-CoA hydratase/isomerase family protein n=1 Tax=Diaphorobacter sp. HDW4B TaxID=2714925 RepID=UPI00140C4B8E|nr:enoyl-CoA hydratase-related protein [Diaphorobacter sp. HDW4B]QIL74013.1 enoyl-CoA hydratase/isomerase family protein [Diaphorobacter sp. HDW4B]